MKETRIKVHFYFPKNNPKSEENFWQHINKSEGGLNIELLEKQERPEDGENAILAYFYIKKNDFLTEGQGKCFIDSWINRIISRDGVPYQVYDVVANN